MTTNFLLVLLLAGSTQLQTLGPFADLPTCENIAVQLKDFKARHKCVTITVPVAK